MTGRGLGAAIAGERRTVGDRHAADAIARLAVGGIVGRPVVGGINRGRRCRDSRSDGGAQWQGCGNRTVLGKWTSVKGEEGRRGTQSEFLGGRVGKTKDGLPGMGRGALARREVGGEERRLRHERKERREGAMGGL